MVNRNFVFMKFIVKCIYYSDAQFTEIDILHVCMYMYF